MQSVERLSLAMFAGTDVRNSPNTPHVAAQHTVFITSWLAMGVGPQVFRLTFPGESGGLYRVGAVNIQKMRFVHDAATLHGRANSPSAGVTNCNRC